MNIKNKMLNKRRQSLKSISHMISFICSYGTDNSSIIAEVGGFQKPGWRHALQSSRSVGNGVPRISSGCDLPWLQA